jgi:uncharacterized protein (TIGR00297 family)
MLTRALLGLALAAAIASAARRTRSLSFGGAIAATFIGTVAVAAGWNWGALLILYFVSSTALSHVRRAEKARRIDGIVEKGGERDAVQVLANGALFAGAAMMMLLRPHARWIALGAGALAASAADTWATEIGTLSRMLPRSIFTGRPVPTGTSGAISLAGTIAMVAGALFIGLSLVVFGWTLEIAVNVTIAGVFGAMLDTVFGATVQARRWCEGCARETERTVHDCGMATTHKRGLGWLDNDLVNFVSSAAGGLLAALLSR